MMGKLFNNFFREQNSKLLVPQFVPKGYVHSYFTYPVLFNGQDYGISWKYFREKFIQFGGDGIYASWKTVSDEGPFKFKEKGLFSGSLKLSSSYGYGATPVADKIQKNYASLQIKGIYQK